MSESSSPTPALLWWAGSPSSDALSWDVALCKAAMYQKWGWVLFTCSCPCQRLYWALLTCGGRWGRLSLRENAWTVVGSVCVRTQFLCIASWVVHAGPATEKQEGRGRWQCLPKGSLETTERKTGKRQRGNPGPPDSCPSLPWQGTTRLCGQSLASPGASVHWK